MVGAVAGQSAGIRLSHWIVPLVWIILIALIDMIRVVMITETNAVNFRKNLGDMLNQVQYRNDSIVINKGGKTVAALVDAEMFARIRRMQERFDALSRRIAQDHDDVPVAEGLDEIDRVVREARHQ